MPSSPPSAFRFSDGFKEALRALRSHTRGSMSKLVRRLIVAGAAALYGETHPDIVENLRAGAVEEE
jgi:hypothetical protein